MDEAEAIKIVREANKTIATLSARLREAEAIIDKLPSQIHIIQKLLLDGGEAEAFEVMDQIKNKALAAEQKEAESDEQA